ncbi:aminoglycoside phosphotransferase family protein [Streptomyces paromomycinus]|uniref:Aminoglycoside phosphotransferase n=1 Tax=Streptomyces paromomycinus TaxID=92743 RepID=A0A401WD02_STREY|nr:aminoglycoside phosphotransferase family protein [Streptomyces paromomycinus]GCD47161.1 aminoglycoside phosphotransferase [Streptomyces paromomycinus]
MSATASHIARLAALAAEAHLGPEADPGPGARPGLEADPGPGPGPGPEVDLGAGPEAGPDPGTDPRPAHRPTLLADRPDATLVRSGRVVAKAHAADCDPERLAVRLRIAAHPALHGILLPPLPLPPLPSPPVADSDGLLTSLPDGRPATRWPYGRPVSPDAPDAAPWEETARLLARLHTVAPSRLPGPVPPMRGPAKAARALARMRAATAEPGTGAPPAPALRRAATTVERAWAQLPPWARDEAPPPRATALCHGDLHLGQLVRHPVPDGPWLLIDIDDLGLGDPAWDLARPAAWFATGLLAPAAWSRFLGAYRAAGGPAVRPRGAPWPELDTPARALTVQTAALAVAKAAAAGRPLDEDEGAVVDACGRMACAGPELADRPEP